MIPSFMIPPSLRPAGQQFDLDLLALRDVQTEILWTQSRRAEKQQTAPGRFGLRDSW
jgi:hypothetical protein